MTVASIVRAADLIRGGGVVAFTGAGISAESGIPTFRDPGGVWDRFDPGDFGTWEGIGRLAMTRPDALAEFLVELRRVFSAARPGPAHLALARLDGAGLMDGVITQNVDGLHQEAGSRNVIEVHGSFRRTRCLSCGRTGELSREGFVENLDRAITGLRTAFVPSLASLLPPCEHCGGPARPDFVAFGEAVQRMDEAEALASACRVLLVVGTSGEVFPAAALPERARAAGATILQVATGSTFIDADLRLDGQAGEVLPVLAEDVISELRWHGRVTTPRRVFVSALTAVLLVSFGGVGQAKTFTVKARANDTWRKVHTYIGKGDRVKWTNPDSEVHDVIAYNGSWIKAQLNPGDSVKKRFKKRKTYFYRCTIHSGIVGGKCQGMCGFVHVL